LDLPWTSPTLSSPAFTHGESGWICPLLGVRINPELAVESASTGQVSAPPSPGSSIERAKLKTEDRQRITDRAVRQAEKRRKEQEAAEEAERRRLAQPSFKLDGDAS
jgi:hypothetical protein